MGIFRRAYNFTVGPFKRAYDWFQKEEERERRAFGAIERVKGSKKVLYIKSLGDELDDFTDFEEIQNERYQ